MKLSRFLAVSSLLTWFLVSCSSKPIPGSPVVARVNQTVLTLAEFENLREQYSDPGISDSHIVSQWIQSELLFQAALKKDFNKDKTLAAAVEEYRRRLLGDHYLESLIQQSRPITNQNIKDYFEANRAGFVRLTDEARIYHFVVDNESEARSIANALIQKRSGGELKSLFKEYRVEVSLVKRGYLMAELDNLIFRSKGNQTVLGPEKIQSRYHVIEVLDVFRVGSSITLDQAYDEIYQRLIQQQIVVTSQKIMDSLYVSNNVETYLETINE